MNRRSFLAIADLTTALLLVLVAPAARVAHAGDSPKGASPPAPNAVVATAAAVGLPAHKEPEAYSVDMIIHLPKAKLSRCARARPRARGRPSHGAPSRRGGGSPRAVSWSAPVRAAATP